MINEIKQALIDIIIGADISLAGTDGKSYAEVYADALLNAGVILPKFPIYSTVYIVDLYDVDNDCSQIGDGSGSKNVQKRVRECFITSYVVSDNSCNLIYYVQPHQLTQKENNGLLSFYWDKGRYEKDIYPTEEEAVNAMKES